MSIRLDTKKFLKNNYIKLGLAVCLCYMGCYTGKTILSAFTPRLTALEIFTKSDIGTMGFALFLAYGFGQVINGTLGDLVSPKYLALIGLSTAAVLVGISPFIPGVTLSTVLWAIIGFFSSMMWGPLTKIVAENSDGAIGRKLMLGLNGSLVAGTMMAYLISALVSALCDNWRMAFFAASGYMLFCAVVYFSVLTALEKKKIIVCTGFSKKKNNTETKKKISWKLLMKNALIPTVIYCMVNGYIRNAVAFWIPTYINTYDGVSPALASTITMIMPILNFFGTMTGLILLNVKIFRGSEHILCACLFGLSTLMLFIIFLLNGSSLVLAVICLFIAAAAMNSACNLIYSVYVFRYRDTGKISTFTGSLDCSAYVASAVGTKTIGLIAEAIGWNSTVGVWSIVACVGGISAVISAIICRKNGVESHI